MIRYFLILKQIYFFTVIFSTLNLFNILLSSTGSTNVSFIWIPHKESAWFTVPRRSPRKSQPKSNQTRSHHHTQTHTHTFFSPFCLQRRSRPIAQFHLFLSVFPSPRGRIHRFLQLSRSSAPCTQPRSLIRGDDSLFSQWPVVVVVVSPATHALLLSCVTRRLGFYTHTRKEGQIGRLVKKEG